MPRGTSTAANVTVEQMKQPEITRLFLKADEVARMIGMKRSFVFAQAREDKIPYVRFGQKAMRFPYDEIMKWIEEVKREYGVGVEG